MPRGDVIFLSWVMLVVGTAQAEESNVNPAEVAVARPAWRSVVPHEFKFVPKALDSTACAVLRDPDSTLEDVVDLPVVRVTADDGRYWQTEALDDHLADIRQSARDEATLRKLGTGVHHIGNERVGFDVVTVFGVPVAAGFGFRW